MSQFRIDEILCGILDEQTFASYFVLQGNIMIMQSFMLLYFPSQQDKSWLYIAETKNM